MSKKISSKDKFLCEHYDAQEHIGDCPRCQKVLDNELKIGERRMKELIIGIIENEMECICSYSEARKHISSKGLIHNRNCIKRVFKELIKEIKTLR